jgi:hypothetical protein
LRLDFLSAGTIGARLNSLVAGDGVDPTRPAHLPDICAIALSRNVFGGKWSFEPGHGYQLGSTAGFIDALPIIARRNRASSNAQRRWRAA